MSERNDGNKEHFLDRMDEIIEGHLLTGDDQALDLCRALNILAEGLPDDSELFDKALEEIDNY